MRKLNLFFFILALLIGLFIIFTNKETLNKSQLPPKESIESKLSESNSITKKLDHQTETKIENLDNKPLFFQKEPSVSTEKNETEEHNNIKEIEEKAFNQTEKPKQILKTEADKIIDSLFPNLTDKSEEDRALKKSLKYSFPRQYMKELLSEEQLTKYFDIYDRMTADFEYLHGTTPIVDEESEKIVNKTIREIHERYIIEFIDILTKEQQIKVVKRIDEEWIPPLREGAKKYGISCLRSPWFD